MKIEINSEDLLALQEELRIAKLKAEHFAAMLNRLRVQAGYIADVYNSEIDVWQKPLT